MHFFKLFTYIVILFTFSYYPSPAQNRFVSPVGNDTGNDCSTPGAPCATIQQAVDQAQANDIITVAVGTYRENVVISKTVTLQGNNIGINGYDTRLAETIVQPAATDLNAGVVIKVMAPGVTIEGFTIMGDNTATTGTAYDAVQGIFLDARNTNYVDLSVRYNIIKDFPRVNIFANLPSAGVSLVGSPSYFSTGHQIEYNLFTDIDDDRLNTANTDVLASGILLTDQVYPAIANNRFIRAGAGVSVNNIPNRPATSSLEINNCYFDDNKVGIYVFNGINIFRPSAAGPSDLVIKGVDIENSIGFGVRAVKNTDNDLDILLENSSITETGNARSSFSGVSSESYNGRGTLTMNIMNCTISDNKNRGITFRGQELISGTNIGFIDNSVIEGNGYNGIIRNSFGVQAGLNAVVSISSSVLSNQSANRTATNHYSTISSNEANGNVAATILVRSCSLTATAGRIATALGNGAVVDASGNWWGTTDESDINRANVGVDFSPWLASGQDEDLAQRGFQPNLDQQYVGMSGSQSGVLGRIQEVISNFPLTHTLVIQDGMYTETPGVDRNITFQPEPNVMLDGIAMNGAGILLTVDGDLTVDQGIDLTAGNIQINPGSAITLTSNARDIAESPVSRVEGMLTYLAGSLGSTQSLNRLGVNFINGSNNLTNLGITRISGSGGVVSGGSGDESIAVTWRIMADNAPNAWNVSFSWPGFYDNGNTISDMAIWEDDGSGSGWEEFLKPLVVSGDPRSTPSFVLNTLGDFTVTNSANVLPVTLVDFTVQPIGDHTGLLSWATLTEINSDFFQVERSISGGDFHAIGKVKSSGNSTERKDYHFKDSELVGVARVFYRLKMVDLDGSYEYSDTRSLSLLAGQKMKIYPNPASTFLMVPIPSAAEGELYIFDHSGRDVLRKRVTDQKIDISPVRPGAYFYRLEIGGQTDFGKLVIER